MKNAIQGFSSRMRSHGMIFLIIVFTILSFSQKVLSGQIETGSFIFEGLNRDYIVFLPQNFQSNMPVVFNLHGWTDNAQWQMDYSAMNDVADTAGFMIVYPNAIYPGFNTGLVAYGWGGPPLPTHVNDVGFILTLIDTMQAHYYIDMNRIYCCGYSNGGYMTYKITGELGHRFAAMASVAGLISDKMAITCNPVRSFPILDIHGTKDFTVTWNGDNLNTWSVEETINFWIENNACIQEPDTLYLPDLVPADSCTVEKIRYLNCADETSILFYKVINGGHHWPGAAIYWGSENLNQDINAGVEMWNFFKNYENPLVNIAYGKSKEISLRYLSPEGNTLKVSSELANPESHPVTVFAFIQGNQSSYNDSLELFDDGLHGDGEADDNLSGGSIWLSGMDKDIYDVTLRTTDLESDITTCLYFPSRFTTIGPVVFDNYIFTSSDKIPNPGDRLKIKLTLKNNGATAPATDIEARLIGPDTLVNIVSANRTYDDIAPGGAVLCDNPYTFDISEDCPGGTEIPFELEISSDGDVFWTDTFSIMVETPTAVSDTKANIPKTFSLKQNYPNPFNPSTTIRFDLPKSSFVTLKIFDILGREIITLVNEKRPAGEYGVEWNSKELPNGIYLYRLKAGDYIETRKLVLQK